METIAKWVAFLAVVAFGLWFIFGPYYVTNADGTRNVHFNPISFGSSVPKGKAEEKKKVDVAAERPKLGTPGGGYVPGAPRSAAECRERGGTDTGTGCRNYR